MSFREGVLYALESGYATGGEQVSVAAKILCRLSPTSFAAVSRIQKSTFLVRLLRGTAPSSGLVSLFDFSLARDSDTVVLYEEEASVWSVQPDWAPEHWSTLREACSGIGALGKGVVKSGIAVQVLNEVQPITCQLLRQLSDVPVVEGDIGAMATVRATLASHIAAWGIGVAGEIHVPCVCPMSCRLLCYSKAAQLFWNASSKQPKILSFVPAWIAFVRQRTSSVRRSSWISVRSGRPSERGGGVCFCLLQWAGVAFGPGRNVMAAGQLAKSYTADCPAPLNWRHYVLRPMRSDSSLLAMLCPHTCCLTTVQCPRLCTPRLVKSLRALVVAARSRSLRPGLIKAYMLCSLHALEGSLLMMVPTGIWLPQSWLCSMGCLRSVHGARTRAWLRVSLSS